MENALKQKQLENKATIKTKQLYQGKLFNLRQDVLEFASHPSYTWEVIEHPGAVTILPINEKGNLLIIKQWRRAIGRIIYELPAGTLHKREDPISCAQRELQEEIGYKSKKLLAFGGLYPTPGFCNEYIHFFIGKQLEKSSLPQDEHEGIDIVEISFKQALEWIDSGEIVDAKTIVGILRYHRVYLNPETDS